MENELINIFPHWEIYQEDLERIKNFVMSDDFNLFLINNVEETKDALLITYMIAEKIKEYNTTRNKEI